MKKILSHLNKAKWFILVGTLWGFLTVFLFYPNSPDAIWYRFASTRYEFIYHLIFFPPENGLLSAVKILRMCTESGAELEVAVHYYGLYIGLAISSFWGGLGGYVFYLTLSLINKTVKKFILKGAWHRVSS